MQYIFLIQQSLQLLWIARARIFLESRSGQSDKFKLKTAVISPPQIPKFSAPQQFPLLYLNKYSSSAEFNNSLNFNILHDLSAHWKHQAATAWMTEKKWVLHVHEFLLPTSN